MMRGLDSGEPPMSTRSQLLAQLAARDPRKRRRAAPEPTPDSDDEVVLLGSQTEAERTLARKVRRSPCSRARPAAPQKSKAMQATSFHAG